MIELKSISSSQVHQIECLFGLLTDVQVDALRKNKNFDHYISPYIKIDEAEDEFLRADTESMFLANTHRFDRDHLNKKLKVLFSSGNKTFNEVDLYLRWISCCSYTLA